MLCCDFVTKNAIAMYNAEKKENAKIQNKDVKE